MKQRLRLSKLSLITHTSLGRLRPTMNSPTADSIVQNQALATRRPVMRRPAHVLALAAGLGMLMATAISASDRWPQFRGMDAGAITDDPALPETWSAAQNVAWSLDIPGLGWSSPVV